MKIGGLSLLLQGYSCQNVARGMYLFSQAQETEESKCYVVAFARYR